MDVLIEEEKYVFIKKDNIFTNSKIIAEELGVKHRSIKNLTEKYKSDFEEFGKLISSFDVLPNRKEKVYLYSEQQATLLLTRVRNSKKVMDFTKELVKQFFFNERRTSKSKNHDFSI